jgi:hypothetical protein
MRKRDAKLAFKSHQVKQLVNAYESMNPNRTLNNKFISKATGISQRDVKYIISRDSGKRGLSVPLYKDPELIDSIHQLILKNGLPSLTVGKVVDGLRSLNLAKLPSQSTVRLIMKKTFGLTFRTFNTANLRYSSRVYDEARVRASQLLTAFLQEDALIVCIDESSFSTNVKKAKHW